MYAGVSCRYITLIGRQKVKDCLKGELVCINRYFVRQKPPVVLRRVSHPMNSGRMFESADHQFFIASSNRYLLTIDFDIGGGVSGDFVLSYNE